jgi:hypothetical protein
VRAQYKAEVDRAQAEAAQGGPLAQANAQRAVIDAQAQLAQQQAQLRQQQLVSEVVKSAEAEMARICLIVDSLQIQSIDDMTASAYGRWRPATKGTSDRYSEHLPPGDIGDDQPPEHDADDRAHRPRSTGWIRLGCVARAGTGQRSPHRCWP